MNFVMSHCVDFSKWTLDQKADLGKVVWKKPAASSWASDVLPALLSTSLAEGMMLAVIQEACFECVGLLQSWATKNPPKSPSWIGWSETELRSRARVWWTTWHYIFPGSAGAMAPASVRPLWNNKFVGRWRWNRWWLQ